MPWTAAQGRRFHAGAARGEPGMAALAAEYDDYARQGKVKPAKKKPAKKAAPAKRAAPKRKVRRGY